MHEFTYYNIFDTKGIEYILTIVFFAILIPFWLTLNREVKIKSVVQKSLGVITSGILNIPKGIFFNKNHTWMHLEKNGVVKLGLDDLVQRITGPVEFVPLKGPGQIVKKGDYIAELIRENKKLKITAPISGKLLSINNEAKDNASLINNDPYNRGWLLSLEPESWVEDTNKCYLAEDASKWASQELARFRDFLAISMKKHSPEYSMIALQDGGELRDHALTELPGGIWHDFQREFLE